MDISNEKKKRIKKYYSQDKIVDEMVRISKFREFAPTYPKGYGSRPDSINYRSDFLNYVKKGAIAFHGSVERWNNPLLIGKLDKDKLRTGWDLIIDIDADEGMDYAKSAILLIIDELTNTFQVEEENISVKFSGNRGFHLGIRNESFPSKIGGKHLKNLYPQLPQAIVGYLRESIEDDLAEEIKKIDSSLSETVENEGPFEVADVENDWGHRHLFRLPYSINEKSWLVSKPLKLDEIKGFDKFEDAKMEEITVEEKFMDSFVENDQGIRDLCVEAVDWYDRKTRHEEKERKEKFKDRDFDLPEEALDKKFFPPPIKKLLSGLDDGRKRALFIIITFLVHVGYDWESIEKEVWEWNSRNKEELKDNYVKSQLNWHKAQETPLMPPNFDSKGWYKDLGVLDEKEDKKMIENFDNPVPYAYVLKKKGENEDKE